MPEGAVTAFTMRPPEKSSTSAFAEKFTLPTSAPPAWLITVEPPTSCVRSIEAVEPVIVPVFVMPPRIGTFVAMPMPETGLVSTTSLSLPLKLELTPIPIAVIVPEFTTAPLNGPPAPSLRPVAPIWMPTARAFGTPASSITITGF